MICQTLLILSPFSRLKQKNEVGFIIAQLSQQENGTIYLRLQLNKQT